MNFTDENKDPISYRCTTYSETGRSFYNRYKSGTVQTKQLVFATGRSGADWLKEMCSS